MEAITFEDSGKLLRLADSLETNAVMGWLSASGTVAKSVMTAENALQNIKKHYKEILTDYPTLRIKMITKDNLQYWSYATDEEIQFDNLIKLVEGAPLDDEVPTPNEPDVAPLWRVHISQINDKTKIKVIASHGIMDGRTTFDLFDLFASYALNQEINDKLKASKNQPVLYEYGKKDWFTKEITDHIIKDPYTDMGLKDTKINPPVTIPSHVINPQWDVAYPPMSKFCRKHGVTPQAILMAIQNEAIRIFNEGKIDDIPVAVYIPIDNRHSVYASELFKKSLFFSHVGFVIPFMPPEKDILKNIKNCAGILKDSLAQTKSCDIAYSSANLRDYETHELSFPSSYPNPATHLFASHLGLVGVGFEDVQFRSHSPVYEGMYWPNLYGFHNKETFSFMFNIPYNCPDTFLQSVKDTSLKYYDYILTDIQE